MGRTRLEPNDEKYAAYRKRYLRDREAILAKAKLKYEQDGPVMREAARKMREAARQARLIGKRRFTTADARRRERNQRFIAEFKVGKACLDCKNVYPPFVMDFDHCRGEKVANISSLVMNAKSLNKILAEIQKCDLVCANCHRMRTFTRPHTKNFYKQFPEIIPAGEQGAKPGQGASEGACRAQSPANSEVC
jgi:hypothetical protein